MGKAHDRAWETESDQGAGGCIMGRSGLRAVVIGAGLAGLACATDLVAAGATVRVLEAGDAVGGRMRTDRQAGFLLDRGFQVFNTSYPQVRRRIDLRALQLRPFTPGMLLHTSRGRVRFTDPTRQPRRAADALTGHLAGPRDMAALALLTSRDMLGPASRIRHRRDQSTLTALRRAGISGELIERLFQPFLAGVFPEDELETSSRFFHLVWRSMLRGSLCLPRYGIQAVPGQLAAALPPASPLAEPTLLVDSEREILHTSVLSEVTPGYASNGRALISTSVLGTGSGSLEPAVRGRLATLYGVGTADWEHLATYTIEGALPAMAAPHPLIRGCRVGPGRYVCGDHRATGSVQGALASGARAAREVLTAAG